MKKKSIKRKIESKNMKSKKAKVKSENKRGRESESEYDPEDQPFLNKQKTKPWLR